MSLFQIPSEYLEKIKKQAEKEYPSECCGVLLGPLSRPQEITALLECRNVQDDYHRQDPKSFPRTSRNAFMLDPGELLALHKRCRSQKEAIRVIYHSHPDAKAYFSQEDRHMAAPNGAPSWPGVAYLVVSVEKGKSGSAALFFWDDGLKDFKELK